MSRSPRAVAAAMTVLLLVPAGGVAAQDASMEASMPEYMAADPSIVDPTPSSWERLEIGPDGRSLRVVFSTGAAGCYGLARVDIDRSGDVPVVTVWTGLRPDAATRICDAMAYEYYTDIAIDVPIIRDGSDLEGTTIAPVAMGPGIGIGDIDAAPAGQILLVNGSLLVGPDGVVRLWESLAESYPPQGVGRSLLVKGLDESEIDWTEAQGTRWSEDVQLLGRVSDGALVIDPLAR